MEWTNCWLISRYFGGTRPSDVHCGKLQKSKHLSLINHNIDALNGLWPGWNEHSLINDRDLFHSSPSDCLFLPNTLHPHPCFSFCMVTVGCSWHCHGHWWISLPPLCNYQYYHLVLWGTHFAFCSGIQNLNNLSEAWTRSLVSVLCFLFGVIWLFAEALKISCGFLLAPRSTINSCSDRDISEYYWPP